MNHDTVITRMSSEEKSDSVKIKPPVCVSDTGLSSIYLCELVAKHLYVSNLLSLTVLVEKIGLAWNVVDELLDMLRNESIVEVKGPAVDESCLRYALTDKGNRYAKDALTRDGYIGVAPVTIEAYQVMVQQQDVHANIIDQKVIASVFHNTVVSKGLLDQVGAAINSSRAVFIYGPPGTGKSYLCSKLSECLPGHVLIPHAIYQDGTVIKIYDPSIHNVVSTRESEDQSILKSEFDHRYKLCKRPVIISGGELTVEQLEVQVNQHAKVYTAPLQLQANNGIYLIDDLGRQKVSPKELFNRWIVPLESHKDFLTVGNGQRISVPFNVILIFSTNLNPLNLADDAFLRRIGHKIQFDYITKDDYRKIWQQVCEQKNIPYEETHLQFLFSELYKIYKIPLLPCHPRDLIDMALDYESYRSGTTEINETALKSAWFNYFISMDHENYENTAYSLNRGDSHAQ